MKLSFALLIALLAAISPQASASPIAYDEGISGDLSASLPGTLLAFDVGVNTIKGSILNQPSTLQADFDSFAFSLGVTTHLAGVTYAFDTTPNAGTTVATASYVLDDGNSFQVLPYLSTATINLLGASPVAVFGGALPLGAGVYGVSADNYTVNGSIPVGWAASYIWSFTVEPDAAPVPEPTSILLVGTGGLGLVRTLWRRKAAFSGSRISGVRA